MAVRVNQANLNTSNQSLNSNNESLKLVSKIRKIKENLDQCYLNASINLNKSLNSTTCSDSLPNVNSHYVNKTGYKSSHPSRYILVSRQALDFELDNNPISLDNLALDQFSEKLTNSYTSDQDLIQSELIMPDLKHAIYSENISRQSSIRSLLTEKNPKFLPNTSMANMKNNFAKIKKIKTKNQMNDELQEYEKEEIHLLQDWDKSSSCRDSPLQNHVPSRPTTRLGFQNEPADWNNLEYSDNVTIASSSSNETNSKYQDIDEYESILITPKSTNMNSKQLSNSCNKILPIKNHDDESESILSDLLTNLQFEEQKLTNNLPNSRFKEFEHDFDVQTTSDVYSEENSLSLNNYNKLAQPSTPNMASLFVREQKIAHTKKLASTVEKNSEKSVNQSPVFNSSLVQRQSTRDDDSSSYKRLSNTINSLFTSLIDNLERQKNKDYLNESECDNKFNSSLFSNSNYQVNKSFDQAMTYSKNKSLPQANSNKESNKDSGFNQEISSLNESQTQLVLKNQAINSKKNSLPCETSESNRIRSNLKSFDFSTQAYKSDSNQISLLDRFLHNEQLVAEKHSKIESVIVAFFNYKNLNLDDYSIIEYILNQEGITIKTFKQLIKEKYYNIEWPNELLLYLHQIVNERESPRSESVDENVDHVSIYEDNYSLNSNMANGSNEYKLVDIENRLNNNSMNRTLIRQEAADISPSRSGSSRSYRRLKEIKNSTNSKRKQSLREDESFGEDQDKLIKSLSNSFTKRRERKGSLPEVATSQIVNGEYELQLSHYSQNSNGTLVNENKTEEKVNRRSRKSAFVLEVLRTSMFRSKSLTDLNNSLLNCERGESILSNSIIKHKSFGANLNILNEKSVENKDKLKKDCFGLIWQCADMCYPEYRNKYVELTWLLNGDKISANSKLKEIEQRLNIEKNLRDKNLDLLHNIENRCKVKDEIENPNIKERLKNQLKLINDKIKELEMMCLFLRICEINSQCLGPEDIESFFRNPSELNIISKGTQQAKSFFEILKMLYGSDAISTGFAYQFFVTYRYMCSSIELLNYFQHIFNKVSYNTDLTKNKIKLVQERTINLLAMWLDGFYSIDFHQNIELLQILESFLNQEIKCYDPKKHEIICDILQSPNIEFNLFTKKSKYFEKINVKYRKQENEPKKSRLFNGASLKKRILNSSAKRARSRSKSKSRERNQHQSRYQDDLNTTTVSSSRIDFLVSDFTIEKIASQLTLIEWDNFLDIHVCHCLNSKAQGVNCDSKQPIDPNIISTQSCLFVDNYLSKSVYKMIQFNYLLTHWIAAEILLSDSSKSQAMLIMKFLKIAKKCCDLANFSSAFSIYEGLQDITVRNLPAWQHVSGKSMQSFEKIISYKILFQNDPFAIYNLTKAMNLPVIPPMHLFLLIVQQQEHGSFQLPNGLWKWTKLGFLSNLVDQIRNVQQHFECNLEPCEEFVEGLLQRIYYLKDFDLNNLAESSFLDYQSQKFNSSMSTIKNLIPKKRAN